jgi:tRNA-binding EMAP/Myf-like protein
MVGFESQGMVLCASNADRSVVEFIDPPAGAKIGERLLVPGVIPDGAPFPVPEVVNPAKKNNPWTAIAGDLRTDGARVATYKGVPLTTSAGPCTAPTQADAPIS